MSKSKILIGVIVLLVLTNAALLFMLKREGRGIPPHEVPRQKVIEHLGFSDQQVKSYDALISEHRKAMRANEDQILQLRTSLYRELTTDVPAAKDSIIIRLGELQMRTEEIHFNHFKDIRKLCTAEQQQRFDEFSGELAWLFSKPRPPRKPD
jgi:protein CpxP